MMHAHAESLNVTPSSRQSFIDAGILAMAGKWKCACMQSVYTSDHAHVYIN